MEYIEIKNWDKFQQYKDRRPNWIKLLIEIIEEFDADGNPKKFYKLPDSAKLTFVLLACLRANYNNKIPYPNNKWLKKRLGIKNLNLQPLIDVGFITINGESVQNCTKTVQNCTETVRQSKRESKSKRERTEKETTVIFDRWNSHKSKKWKSHAKMSYEIEQAITEQLKHYSVDELCGAIDNYANILLSPDFTWSYAWTLQQFLTRSRPDNRQEKQLWRFLPNNYHDDDYLTDSVRKTRVRHRKEFTNYIQIECEDEVLIKGYQKNHMNLNWLIDELRPDIRGKAQRKEQ